MNKTDSILPFSTGGCQFEITIPEGSISSPNWPNFYPSRKDCTWRFTTTDGHRVELVSLTKPFETCVSMIAKNFYIST